MLIEAVWWPGLSCLLSYLVPSLAIHQEKQVILTINNHQEKRMKKYEKKRADLELCQDLGSSILNDASLFLFFFLLIPGFFFFKA